MRLPASFGRAAAAFVGRWSGRRRFGVTFCVCLTAFLTAASGQDESVGKTFEEQSAALRTALHYDPSLGQPLRTLVELYEKAERVDELLGLYRAHVSQYPDDAGAQVVLIRLLKHLQRPEATELLQSAVQRFPDQAMLQYLQFEWYKKSDDTRALETLSKAVNLQTIPDRRDTWLDELLELSRAGGESEVAKKHLLAQRAVAGTDAGALLAAAQRMHRYHFYELAIETLSAAETGQLEPEAQVEVQMLLAKSEAAVGKRAEAGARVAALLDTVAADYWRRRELMTLRMQLVESPAERDRLLRVAREAHEAADGTSAESAALDYAELLGIAGKRAEAAKVLVNATSALPKSERIEKAAIEALERIGDEEGMRKYLEQRSAEQPERSDLRYRLVQAQYLAGEDAAAEKNLDVVLSALEGSEKVERLLDLARYLRKANLGQAAVTVQQRVVEAWPQRLDVRRELAETLIGLEQRGKAAEVIRNSDFEGAEIENFLDLVQFMVQSEFHVEARDALRRRLNAAPDNFDLQLLLVEVLAKTSEREAGEKLLAESRDLADTALQYRRWVETGLAFHKVFNKGELFFDREQFGFATAEGDAAWDEDRISRFMALIEAGSDEKLDARVTQALRNQLARTDLPEELSLKLRSLLVKTLENAPEHAVEVEQHLRELAVADPARASGYDLRRALLYHGAQRPDLAQELIANIELSGIKDQALLRAAYVMFLDYGSVRLAVECVERLAEQHPDDLINYQRQLALYAALGEEESLRRTLRQLLTGVDKIQFQQETLKAVRAHLLDSYWRSISAQISDNSAEVVTTVSELLDAVERESLSSSDRLWVLWTRAWLLNRSGQQDGRDAILAELENAVTEMGVAADQRQTAQIVFPDGLGTTLAAARSMLTRQVEGNSPPKTELESAGPLRELSMEWAFETDGGARLVQIEEAGDVVLALDEGGTVYCMDANTGKLQWRERLLVPQQGIQPPLAVSGGSSALGASSTVSNSSDAEIALREVQLSAQILVDGSGNFLMPIGDVIECRSVADGSLKWATDLGLENGSPPWAATHDLREARPSLEMAIRDGRVLAYAPAIGVAAAIESASGKLLWLRTLNGADVENGEVGGVFDISSGAAFGADGQMLVFGARSEILDQADGSTLWSLGLKVARKFPLRLRSLTDDELDARDREFERADAADTDAGERPAVGSGLATVSSLGVSISHGADAGIRLAAAGNFVKFSGSLLAPAAEWVRRATRSKGGFSHDAEIVNGDLILAGVGLYRISLDLPVSARHFESELSATWLGMAGSHAWTFDGTRLRAVNLDTRADLTVELGDVVGEHGVAAAVLHGSRIYVSGDSGVLVLNAFNGTKVAKIEWPIAFSDYRARREATGVGAWSDMVSARRVWQGSVFGSAGQPFSCVPDEAHLKITARRLYVSTGGGAFAALVEKAD
jgi:outer membrane protein assembly factor BamB